MINDITMFGDPMEWEGSGDLTDTMLDFTNFDRWLNMITMEFRNVITRYGAAVRDDGVIDVMEKKLIVKELDEFFNCLIALRFHLMKSDTEFTIADDKYGYTYTIRKTETGWGGEGFFSKSYRLNMDKFENWYQDTMLKRFDEFSGLYRKIVEDGKIDAKEAESMNGILDHLIFELLVVRHYINRGIWKA